MTIFDTALYLCSDCGRTFSSVAEKKQHQEKTGHGKEKEDGEDDFICPLCGSNMDSCDCAEPAPRNS